MKSYLLFTLLLLANLLNAQITVPETTKSFYGIVEATWCGHCGQHGIPATENIIAQTSPKAIYVSLHKSISSELFSQTGSDLATAFGAIGQPIFTLNGTNWGTYTTSLVADMASSIDTYYSASSASINAGFEYGIVGNTLYVRTKTTFFQDLTGEYYVGIYVYEDSIWEWQANYDPGIPDMDIWHNHVLRTSLNGHFGQQIASGTISSGSSFNLNKNIVLDDAWNADQLHVFTIIWKKNGTIYEFVNANDVGSIITGTAGLDIETAPTLIAFPNPTNQYFEIRGIDPSELVTISIFDLQGKLILTANQPTEIDLNSLSSGTYILEILYKGAIYKQKISKL